MEYLITSVELTTASCTNWQQAISLLPLYFLGLNGPCDLYPPCELWEPYIREVVYEATCWKIVNQNPNPTQEPRLVAVPCEESGYCKSIYEKCCDNLGHWGISKVASVNVIPGSCSTEFPEGSYLLNECYIMIPPCDIEQ